MDIKYWMIIGAFYLIRAFFSNKKKNAEKRNLQTGAAVSNKKKNKTLDDIFGDFMNEINQKKEVPKTIVSNKDTHKAEADTHKKLNWQNVTTSKFEEKEQLIKHSDYKNISHSDMEDKPYVPTKVEDDFEINELEQIDLRKAILYKEILERKYFTI